MRRSFRTPVIVACGSQGVALGWYAVSLWDTGRDAVFRWDVAPGCGCRLECWGWDVVAGCRLPPKSSRKESGLQDLAAGIHGQIPCQEHSVADDTENRWKLGHGIPTGFGVVGSEAKNGYAGIRVSVGTLLRDAVAG